MEEAVKGIVSNIVINVANIISGEKPNIQRQITSETLGKNNTSNHEEIYKRIEEKIGQYKKCTFGKINGSKTGVKHEGDEDVPIRNFSLLLTKGKERLQGQCKDCEKKRRQVRLNTSRNKFENKSFEEISKIYEKEYQKNTKECSNCKIEKKLEMFNLSPGMESGFHNHCKTCSISNAVGDRRIIYQPDGSFKYRKKNMKGMHDDHIFPISLGGSDNKENHQLLEASENIKKSNGLSHFKEISDIKPKMLSERYRDSLTKCKTINELKIHLSKRVNEDIEKRNKMNDNELKENYKNYFKKNNLRFNVDRSIEKFRDFCKKRNYN